MKRFSNRALLSSRNNARSRRRPTSSEPLESRCLLTAVAVFNNGVYVDIGSSTSNESTNVQASLTSLGHTVTTFTSTNAADIAEALGDVDAVLIPELERRALLPALSAAALAELRDFVSNGGTFLINGDSGRDDENLLNALFGSSLEQGINRSDGAPINKTAAAAGTAFADAPDTVRANNGTWMQSLASQPEETVVLYGDENHVAASVTDFGDGQVVFLAFDWFNAAPRGSQDGGWLEVLDIAAGPVASTTLDADIVDGDLIIEDLVGRFNSIEVSATATDLVIDAGPATFSSFPAAGTLSDGDQVLSVPLSAISGGVLLDTGVGNDVIKINSVGSSLDSLTIDSGAGNDRVHFDADASLGFVRLIDSVGTDLIDFTSTLADVSVRLNTTEVQVVNSNLSLQLDSVFEFENATGGSGNDLLVGNGLANGLKGLDGDDTLSGGVGRDTLTGGGGNDRLIGGNDGDSLLGNEGDDTLKGGNGGDILTDDLGNNLFDGESGNDELYAGSGNDTLIGGPGFDLSLGGAGNDTYLLAETAPSAGDFDVLREFTGGGVDTISFETVTDDVTFSLNTSRIQDAHVNRELTLNRPDEFENLIGGTGNDLLRGNTGENSLEGLAGDDTLYGSSGADTLDAGDGDDSLNGGIGSDSLIGGLGDDRYAFGKTTGGPENDRVREQPESGTDTLSFASQTVAVSLSLRSRAVQEVHSGRTLQLNTRNVIENLIGGSGNDRLIGNSLDNTLKGGSGNDTLSGSFGNDLLLGQAGDDTMNGGLGDDTLAGGQDDDWYSFGQTDSDADLAREFVGQGTDTLSFNSQTIDVALNLGSNAVQDVHAGRTLQLNSNRVFENAAGGSGNDTLIGNTLDNQLRGHGGNDAVIGLTGNDELRGNGGRDLAIGGAGFDTLFGGAEDDILVSGIADDTSQATLESILAAWSTDGYATRLRKLRDGVGSPDVSLEAGVNITDDGNAAEELIGGSGKDWFFLGLTDSVTDRTPGEVLDIL